jgi:hypothetical protein
MKPDEDRRSGGGYWFAFILIAIGVILLLQNYGLISSDVWPQLFRFWPLLLIFAGMDILLGRSLVGKLFVITASIITLVIIITSRFPMPVLNQMTTTVISTVKYNPDNVSKKIVDIQISSGSLDLSVGDYLDYLSVSSTHLTSGQPIVESSLSDRTLNLAVKETHNFPVDRNSYDIRVGQADIATDLVINLGAGKATLNISRHKLNRLDLTIGAGSATLELPTEIGLKINYKIGAGNLQDGDTNVGGLGKSGTYLSPGEGKSAQVVEITADIGAGSLKILRSE